jgi:hypothetical protein
MPELMMVELRYPGEISKATEPSVTPALRVRIQVNVAGPTPPKSNDNKTVPDEFEIRRREFFGL